MLNALGYDAGNPTGRRGPQSEQAIRTFQIDQGFEATGILNESESAMLTELYEVSFGSDNSSTETSGTNEVVELKTSDAANYHRNEFTNPYLARDIIVSDNDILIERISGLTHPTLLSVFSKPDALNNTFLASIPIVGCSKDPFLVYGYYNPGLHIWTLVRLERHSRSVADVRLSAGFSPKEHQEKTAWYDLVQVSGGVLHALKNATKIQIESFQEIFPYQGCSDFGELDQLFSQDEALYNLLVYQNELPNNSAELIENMRSIIAETFNIQDESILENMSLVKTVLGYNYLSIFTSRTNPNLVFIQGWDTDTNGLQLREQSHGLLYKVE